MKYKKRQLLASLMLLALAAVALRLFIVRQGVDPRNVVLIQRGMTEAEVCRILGGPPDESKHADFFRGPETALAQVKIWEAYEYQIGVWFDDDGRVVDKQGKWIGEEPDPFYARFLRPLGFEMGPQRVRE